MIQKEIWLNTLVENLFAPRTFMSKSIDDGAFVVEGKKVHVPNAGKASKVEVNRSELPATATARKDTDLEYEIDEHTTDPVHIPNAETVELSYDKRQSVIATDREALEESVAVNMLYRWAGKVDVKHVVKTTGAARKAHTSETATNNRKKVTRADVESLMNLMNADGVPQTGRYLLLDAFMYGDLFSDLTEAQQNAFLSCADAQRGVLGKFASFEILDPRQVLRVKASDGKTLIKWGAADEATELAAGLAWQESCVSHAKGETKMFSKEDDPQYYGDIYSFLVRAGGAPRRNDLKGVALLVEDAAA